jgi:adenosylcobinamide hydrolase
VKSLNKTKSHHVWLKETSLVIEFEKPVNIISTSQLNGGLQKNIKAIFNNQIPFVNQATELPGGSVSAYLALTAKELNLDPQKSAGLLTSASMENVAMEKLFFQDLTVEAYVTGGINVNGGRAGDPASYYEQDGNFIPLGGTINILLYINANLTPEALVKSVITATEAKTVALQELVAPSQYSTGLASGSGTDGIIVACNPQSSMTLTDAGLHSKLGELIGQTVISATKRALERETGLSQKSQYNVLARLKRYKIAEGILEKRFAAKYPNYANQTRYREALNCLAQRDEWIYLASALIHIQDQVNWGLLPYRQALMTTKRLLVSSLGQKFDFTNVSNQFSLLDYLIEAINATIYHNLTKDSQAL